MRIEMVLPTLAAAGMETMIARMVEKLARRGHAVGISCIEAAGPLAARVADAGVRVSEIDAHGLLSPGWLRRLSAHMRQIEPDVVHVHSGALFKGVTAARLARAPVVLATQHGFVDRQTLLARTLDRCAMALSDHVVAVSDHLKDELARNGARRSRLSVIVNGIDTEMFAPAAGGGGGRGRIRTRLGIAQSTAIVGTVARLASIKNQAMLIDAVALAVGRGVDCAAVLIGDGPLRDALSAQAQALGIGGRVHFWGLELDVARLYPELDVFVLSSDLEGTSISLLEAMSCGVCPVATAVGGNTALIEDGTCGVLVPARSPQPLAATIEDLIVDPAKRRALGARARQRILARFSDEAMIDAYERLYLTAGRAPGAADVPASRVRDALSRQVARRRRLG